MIGYSKISLNLCFLRKIINMIDPSIQEPDYVEHDEKDYVNENQWLRNVDMFRRGKQSVLYPPTKDMYEYVRNTCIDHVKNHPQYPKFVWKPKICDMGCGGGFGSYILSHEADFVWGIDISEPSIGWCKAVFEKHKNNIYYSSQLTFDVIDIRKEPRTIAPFDIVVCIEVIEHLQDYTKVLDFVKRLCKKDKKGNYPEPPDGTIAYISSPNRNYKTMGDKKPKNYRHVREWTPAELYGILVKHFKYVVLRNPKGEVQGLDTLEPHMLFQCEVPI